MRCVLLLATVVWVSLSGFSRADELRLLNGDRVKGHLDSLEGNQLLVQPRWAETPVTIPARFMGYSRMNRVVPASPHQMDALLRFSNGDQLHAELRSLSPEQGSMMSTWGQRLEVHPRMLTSIDFLQKSGLTLINGIGTADDWDVQPSGRGATKPAKWVGGTLLISGGFRASRRVEAYPERFHVRLRIRAAQDSYYLSFSPYSENNRTPSPGGYTIQFNRTHVFCSIMNAKGNKANSWNVDSRISAHQSGGLIVDLYGDRKKGTHAMYLNGKSFQTWTTPPQAKEVAEGMQWINLDSHNSYNLNLSDLRVEEWTGPLPPDEEEGSKSNNGSDLLLLRNGDRVEGRMMKIDAHSVFLQLTGQTNTLEVARTRVSRLVLQAQERYRARRNNRDVECFVGDGGDRLVLSLDELNAETLSGTSEQWRDVVKVPRDTISLIRFNIYLQRRLDNEEFVEEWLFAPDATGRSATGN